MSLFKDGKKYREHVYEGEKGEEELERDVVNNAKLFFGKDSIYIDSKKKLKNTALGNTIPDGFLFNLARPEDPEFYIVEFELAKHDFYRHIFNQLTKFFSFFTKKQDDLIDHIYSYIEEHPELRREFTKKLGKKEVFKFLKDTIENSQNILLVIDEEPAELPEIMETYTDTWGKLVKTLVFHKYTSGKETIFTLTPDFEIIEYVGTADQQEAKDVVYTEEYHLEGTSEVVKKIYSKMKEQILNINSEILFNPQRYYISIRTKKNIAYFDLQKTKIRLTVLQPEDEVRKKIKSYKIIHLGDGVQKFYNSPCCSIILDSEENLDEVVKLLKPQIEQTNMDV